LIIFVFVFQEKEVGMTPFYLVKIFKHIEQKYSLKKKNIREGGVNVPPFAALKMIVVNTP
jgi:hypothetical protein